MFYQIFLSPQVKRCTIITYKHSIYELPHELPKDLRLRILGNEEILGKGLNFIEWYNDTFPPVCYLTQKLELVSNIPWLIEVNNKS